MLNIRYLYDENSKKDTKRANFLKATLFNAFFYFVVALWFHVRSTIYVIMEDEENTEDFSDEATLSSQEESGEGYF